MTATVRLQLDLPALTPAQADILWSFVQDLGAKLWEAYEPELLEIVRQDSLASDLAPDPDLDTSDT